MVRWRRWLRDCQALRHRSLNFLLLGIAGILLAACSVARAERVAPTPLPDTATPTAQVAALAPTQVPTQTPEPAATPTPAPTLPPTATPTDRPTATPVPTSQPAVVLGTEPVRLVIPSLQMDTPVQEMTWSVANGESDWNIPENAAGHAVNSALLGQQGNVVISGHNNIYGHVFMKISQKWPAKGFKRIDPYTDSSSALNGKEILLYGADGNAYPYTITAFYRVKDSGVPLEQRLANGKFIDPTEDPQLTLTTCWPPWSNTYRLIVVAQPAAGQ